MQLKQNCDSWKLAVYAQLWLFGLSSITLCPSLSTANVEAAELPAVMSFGCDRYLMFQFTNPVRIFISTILEITFINNLVPYIICSLKQ